MNNRDFDRNLNDELRDHLERRTADLIKAGLTAAEAHRRARIEFGALEARKEEIRDASWSTMVANLPEQLWRETRLGFRRLLATPGFALFAIMSIAVGIGITTAVYSVVYPMIRPTVSLRDVTTLVYLTAPVTEVSSGRSWHYTTARGDFEEIAAVQQTLSHVAAWTPFFQPLVDGSTRVPVRGEAVTASAFEAVGARAALGRILVQADDATTAAPVVFLNHSFWKQRLHGDPDVIGRSVRLGGQPVEIVGVAEPSFRGFGKPMLYGDAALWMPLTAAARFPNMARSAIDPSNHQGMSLSVIGRLKAGRSVAEANMEIAAIGRRLDRAFPIQVKTRFWNPPPDEHGGAPRGWQATRVDEALSGQNPFAWVTGVALVGLVALVLAVACTNLANLTIARGSARMHEFATRRALGSSRWRLVREQTVESAILAVAGGALGLALARAMLIAVIEALPAGLDVGIATDLLPGVVAGSMGLVFVSLFVVGLWPAWQLSRADLRSSLSSDAGTSGAVRWKLRRRFISAQVAISVAFFLVAAMFVRSVAVQAQNDTGVDLDRVGISNISFRLFQWDETRVRATLDRIAAAARQEGQFEAVAVTAGLPFGAYGDQADIATSEKPFAADAKDNISTHVVSASPEIFRVLGVPLVRGRGFDARDGAGTPGVVILSEQCARDLFNTIDVVGRQVLTRDDLWADADRSGQRDLPTTVRALEVIGVARDTDVFAAGIRDRNLMYLPYAQRYYQDVALVVRTSGDPAAAAAVLPGIVHRADPDLVTGLTGPASTLLNGRAESTRFMAGMGSGLGVIVLVLAMTGLFGVLSQLVARRTRELGVRMALGATARDLVRLVLLDGMRPVLTGLAIGLVVGTLGRFGFRAIVSANGFQAVDPAAMAVVPLLLLIAGALACYWPARRASRVDPNVALRNL